MCLLLHYLRHAVLNSHTWNTATLTMQVLESRDFSRGTVPLQLPFGTITIWQRRMDVTATCSMTRESATYPYLHTTSKTLFCTFTRFWKGKGVEVSRRAFFTISQACHGNVTLRCWPNSCKVHYPCELIVTFWMMKMSWLHPRKQSGAFNS